MARRKDMTLMGSAAALVFTIGVLVLVALGFARALFKGI
jgi:hypothetical protein